MITLLLSAQFRTSRCLLHAGPPLRSRGAIKARLGLAPQEENLDPDLAARNNLVIYATYFGVPRPEQRARVRAKLLAFRALSDKAGARIATCRGG